MTVIPESVTGGASVTHFVIKGYSVSLNRPARFDEGPGTRIFPGIKPCAGRQTFIRTHTIQCREAVSKNGGKWRLRSRSDERVSPMAQRCTRDVFATQMIMRRLGVNVAGWFEETRW